MEKVKITQLTDNDRDFLRSKSAETLPDNPSDKGLSAAQIKAKYYEPIKILFEWLKKTQIDTQNGFNYLSSESNLFIKEVINKLVEEEVIYPGTKGRQLENNKIDKTDTVRFIYPNDAVITDEEDREYLIKYPDRCVIFYNNLPYYLGGTSSTSYRFYTVLRKQTNGLRLSWLTYTLETGKIGVTTKDYNDIEIFYDDDRPENPVNGQVICVINSEDKTQEYYQYEYYAKNKPLRIKPFGKHHYIEIPINDKIVDWIGRIDNNGKDYHFVDSTNNIYFSFDGSIQFLENIIRLQGVLYAHIIDNSVYHFNNFIDFTYNDSLTWNSFFVINVIQNHQDDKFVTLKKVDSEIAAKIAALVDSAPAEMDTLKELADAIVDNKDAMDIIIKSIADKVSKIPTEASLIKLYGHNGNSDVTGFTATSYPSGGTVMYRDGQGKSRVGTPTRADEVKYIVNIEYLNDNTMQVINVKNNDIESEINKTYLELNPEKCILISNGYTYLFYDKIGNELLRFYAVIGRTSSSLKFNVRILDYSVINHRVSSFYNVTLGLKDFADDENHRLVTDEQITKWDSGFRIITIPVASTVNITDSETLQFIKEHPDKVVFVRDNMPYLYRQKFGTDSYMWETKLSFYSSGGTMYNRIQVFYETGKVTVFLNQKVPMSGFTNDLEVTLYDGVPSFSNINNIELAESEWLDGHELTEFKRIKIFYASDIYPEGDYAVGKLEFDVEQVDNLSDMRQSTILQTETNEAYTLLVDIDYRNIITFRRLGTWRSDATLENIKIIGIK